jgi:hypothetical protein
MRTISLCFALLLSAPALGDEWVTVTHGNLSWQMPAEPTMKKEAVKTDSGDIANISYEVPGSRSYTAVMIAEFPKKMMTPDQVPERLENGRDRAVENVGAELVTDKEISLDDPRKKGAKLKGREFESRILAQGVHGHQRMVVVDATLVQFIFVRPEKDAAKAVDFDKMTASFKVTKAAAAAKK